ncbi:hypothetical protein M9458_006683, partial [Cirrhinus mrigala]
QGYRSLEDHTKDFVFLSKHTHYLPHERSCPGEVLRESLAAYIEWMRVSCNSSGNVDIMDNDTSHTQDPEPSQPPPRFVKHKPEPTADGEPEPNATEPSPKGATAEVREPATLNVMVDVSVERESAEESIAAEGELNLDLGLLYVEQDLINFNEDKYADIPPLLPPSFELSACFKPPVCPELSNCLDFPTHPPSLPSLPPSLGYLLLSALLPHPSAHPQPTICAVGSPRVCQSPSVSWLEDPSSQPPASDSSTMAPSSVGPPAPPGSLIPPSPPSLRSVVVPPSPQESIPLALLGSSLSSASSLCHPMAPPWTSGSPPQLPETWAPPWPSGSLVSSWLIGSLSPPRAPPPPAPLPSVGPLESSALPPPWLLPPSALLWATIKAAAWLLLFRVPSVSSLAPLSVVTTLNFVCYPPPGSPFSARASSYTDFLLPSHVHSFVFVFFYGARSRLPGGGCNITPHWTVCVGFSLL